MNRWGETEIGQVVTQGLINYAEFVANTWESTDCDIGASVSQGTHPHPRFNESSNFYMCRWKLEKVQLIFLNLICHLIAKSKLMNYRFGAKKWIHRNDADIGNIRVERVVPVCRQVAKMQLPAIKLVFKSLIDQRELSETLRTRWIFFFAKPQFSTDDKCRKLAFLTQPPAHN